MATFLFVSKIGISQTKEDTDTSETFVTGKIIGPEFPGGLSAWASYLKNNLNTSIPIENKAPKGKYQVIIKFVVAKDSTIKDVEAETHFGYGMEEEAIRVISNSPKWIPGMINDSIVNYFRQQPVTFKIR